MLCLIPYRGLQGLRDSQIEAAPAVHADKIDDAQSTHFWRKLLFFNSASTLAGVMAEYFERSVAFSHSKYFMPFSVYGFRPKWPYAAVIWYFGSRNCRDFAMAPGRQSKLIFTIFVIASGVKLPVSVPYVSTKSESGLATPIAYESCTSARLERPLFTTDLAICRQMYAAERSTFVGSLPENAPPPCAPHPPYVSMMILRPVRPASPWGPPMMNLPDGLMCKC